MCDGMRTLKYNRLYAKLSIILLIAVIIAVGLIVWYELFGSPKKYKDDTKQNEVVKVVEPVITRADNEYFEGKKLVAITFDDGPSSTVTTRLLDELDKRDAKVTFFMVGNRAENQTELVKRVYNSGHTIGNHSYSHKSFNKQTPEEYLNEINSTNFILSSITGDDVIFVRPPYGSYKQSTLENVNMNFVLWSIDTLDWKTRNADMVYEEIVTKVEDGSIILMHDLYESTADAAIRAIDYLLENGYAVVSLEEMYRIRGLEPEMHASIRHIDPPVIEEEVVEVVEDTQGNEEVNEKEVSS
jgi:peptidoglycan/xylan/chitin deacetylase (PgdA/CDA1 family)